MAPHITKTNTNCRGCWIAFQHYRADTDKDQNQYKLAKLEKLFVN